MENHKFVAEKNTENWENGTDLRLSINE